MNHTQTADRIIHLAEVLGYGIDISFLPSKNPIKIKAPRSRQVTFATMDEALKFLQTAYDRQMEFRGKPTCYNSLQFSR